MSESPVKKSPARSRTPVLVGAIALLTVTLSAGAQAPANVRTAFLKWMDSDLHPVSGADLDASTRDLAPIAKMIGKAKIVGLSEAVHGASEPLIFRNRLFRHLVEYEGFSAIALESGLVESQLLNDYVAGGKDDLGLVLEQGFSNGHGTFRQNRELLLWLREYNARLPRGAAKVQIFGLDLPGSPGNFDAARGPDTGLRSALQYLRTVDPEAAVNLQSRVDTYLPVLKGINGYGDLAQPARDSLTAAIADLVSLMERERHAYVARSSREQFDWAERAAVGARQTDDWFRRMPLAWKLEHGLEWTRYAMQVRDRSMADNLEWVRGRIPANRRLLVFAGVGHVAATHAQVPGSPFRDMTSLGSYLEERYGEDFVNVLNVVMNGEIKYCSANPQRELPLKAPPESAIEPLFASPQIPRYMLDLRRAPPAVASWLRQVHDHWNGFGAVQFATLDAFDLVYYVSPLTPACTPP